MCAPMPPDTVRPLVEKFNSCATSPKLVYWEMFCAAGVIGRRTMYPDTPIETFDVSG